jgi:hypothetical protein
VDPLGCSDCISIVELSLLQLYSKMAEIFKNLFGGKAEPAQKPVSDDGE